MQREKYHTKERKHYLTEYIRQPWLFVAILFIAVVFSIPSLIYNRDSPSVAMCFISGLLFGILLCVIKMRD